MGISFKNQAHLETTLEDIRLDIHSEYRKLKILTIDNQFVTEPIRKWVKNIRPCIPHKHWALGEIKRLNRTLEDGIVKQLYGKEHLDFTYWAHAYKDIIMHSNFNCSAHAAHGMSPFKQWTGEKPDLQKYPMLPFGSIIMAHIPVSQQSAGSQRSNVTYCVGTSNLHKKGLNYIIHKLRRQLYVVPSKQSVQKD